MELENWWPPDPSILGWAAIAVSTFALILHWRRHVREKNLSREREAEKREAQASRISAWVRQGDVGSTELYAELGNKSELPVRHATLLVLDDADEVVHVDHYTIVPPGAALSRRLPKHINSAHEERYRATVSFTDSSGQRWQRTRSGNLSALPPRFTVFSGLDVQRGLSKYKQLFQEEFGLKLTVVSNYGGMDLRHFFKKTAVYAETDCDAIVGPHDWIGELNDAKLLKTVPVKRPSHKTNMERHVAGSFPGASVKRTPDLVEEAFNVFDLGLKSLGVPLAYETAVLHVNRDLVKEELPDSIHGLFELGQRHVSAGCPPLAVSMGERQGRGDPFMMWPLLGSLGGVLLGPSGDDAWRPSIKALESGDLLESLVSLHKLARRHPDSFRPETSHDTARRLYADGKSPFLVDGVGATSAVRPRFNYEIHEIPTQVKLPRPNLSMIYGFFFREFGHGDEVSHQRRRFARNGEDFLHYHLSSKAVCEELSAAMGTPVIWRGGLIHADSSAAVVQRACCNARPMPWAANMATVWNALGKLLNDVVKHGEVERSLDCAAAAFEAAGVNTDGG